MPQMMPINWIMSFFIFICIFIMFNIMNYYIYSPNFSINKNKMKFNKNNINWKW
uniref:ATP synthase F0 subunit 8 n=1 Tax=Dolbina paraexacta TaxID=1502329 RepID=UPI002204A7B7|nr:ATP synthase F0 subunit 8 [Dolbina paraexacta]YP_010952596.1 ATP synthase F0 subunit 8 [Dolbina tancrei]UXR12274.1 ATP synthase F0 subunit 8 [Dolbina paraexacta]WMQ52942.1 ATP synthase F0 subunit 8 [Dolbina tancrei]